MFDDYETIYDRHPSLYHAAFQLDLYPNEATIITLGDVMNQEFNLNQKN